MANSESNLPASRVGLVAGGGRFPVIVAESLRRRGVEVVCAALRHQASAELAPAVKHFRAFGLGRLNACLRFFRRHGVSEVCWAGWIRKEELFKPWRLLSILPDWRMFKVYFLQVADRQNQTLLSAFADEFESQGFHLNHSANYCPELLAPEGVLTRRAPSRKQLEDIAFGWTIARRMADLDVGQSVAVCERSTLAVEGIEGTDRNILRAGEFYRRGGFTVVKLAKKDHDMRFDIPAVGPLTIAALHKAGGAVLAVEAGRTLLLDREEMVAAANRHGIVVIALKSAPELR